MPAKATLTADQLLARYTAYLHHERYRAAKTIDNYANTLRHFWRFVGKSPEQVTPADLAAFVNRRPVPGGNARGKRLSPHTKSTLVVHVRRFYTVGYAKGWIASNPLADVLTPRADLGPPRSLALEKVAALLAHVATDPRLEVMAWLAYGCGLRVGEIATARIEDVALGTRPSVRVHGKGGRSRLVPLASIVGAVLGRALDGRPQVGPVVDNRMRPGEHLRPKYVSRLLAEAMHQAGIRESAHALRHTFATLLLSEAGGTNLHAISYLLGHGSITVTQRYTRGFDADASAAVKLLPDPRRGPRTLSPKVDGVFSAVPDVPAEAPELPPVVGVPAPDDLLDHLQRAAPGLAHACASDTRRLAELVPVVRDLFARVAEHSTGLDVAMAQVFGGPFRIPDGAGELASRLLGLADSWNLADALVAAHPDLH